MRIAFVTRQCWPAVGGVESVVDSLGGALTAAGHEVTVVAQAVDELHFGRMTHLVRERLPFEPFVRNGMPVVQFRPSRRRRLLLLPLAAELVPFGGRITRKWLGMYSSGYYARVVGGVLGPLLTGADVVHVLGSNFMAVAAVETAHALGKAVVVSPFAHAGEWGDDSVSIRAYRRAEAVIATTHADATLYAGLGVATDRLHVAGLPVPNVEVAPGAPDGYEPGAPLVVYLGQRRPTKRVELLVAATQHVWAARPDARFAFLGPGERVSVRDPRILELGRVSDADRGRWLAAADVLCLPSSSESFGLVVAEAWSVRVPVVVSDIAVLRELVTASGGGVCVNADPESFGAAIVSLLDDPARARALGEAGHVYWRAALAPDAVAKRHLEIYRQIT